MAGLSVSEYGVEVFGLPGGGSGVWERLGWRHDSVPPGPPVVLYPVVFVVDVVVAVVAHRDQVGIV